MKTAISIPDDVFWQAEYVAKKRGLSRSEFYVLAIRAFIQERKADSITEQLNKVYAADPTYDQKVEAAALADLSREDR